MFAYNGVYHIDNGRIRTLVLYQMRTKQFVKANSAVKSLTQRNAEYDYENRFGKIDER